MYIQGKYLLAGLHDISECLAIRKEVFGGEQNFPSAAAEDADDKSAVFVLAYQTEIEHNSTYNVENEIKKTERMIPVGTGRLLFLGDIYKIGRIAVKKEFRGQGYGDFIVRMLVDKAFLMGAKEVFVGAQEHAIPFYEKIGFIKQEESYEEDHIIHYMMKITPHTCKRDCMH